MADVSTEIGERQENLFRISDIIAKVIISHFASYFAECSCVCDICKSEGFVSR